MVRILQVLAIEFVLLAIDFIPFANEFVLLANEFVPLAKLAIEFIALAWKFVRNKIGSVNSQLSAPELATVITSGKKVAETKTLYR